MTASSQLLRSQILQTLVDDQFHSGQTLADTFGVSRAAIANHINALIDLGVDIYSVKGKGYKLATHIDLLNQSTIMGAMTYQQPFILDVYPVIDSTNTFMKSHIDEMKHQQVIIAEAQTAGRGRRGKQWVSPFGASIYLSMCWRFQGGYQQIGGLSLFVGFCICQALERMGVDGLGLKWPNDIYRHGKKLGGILVEVEGQLGGEVACIIGIGLNVNLGEQQAIDQPFTDLADRGVDRNYISSAILDVLLKELPEFEMTGLTNIIDRWNALDVFMDQRVVVSSSSNRVEGENKGIDKNGALQLKTSSGMLSIHGGEVSLRAKI